MRTRIPPYRIGVWCLSQIKLKLELKLSFAISEISKQNQYKLSLVNLVLLFNAKVSFNADKMHTEKNPSRCLYYHLKNIQLKAWHLSKYVIKKNDCEKWNHIWTALCFFQRESPHEMAVSHLYKQSHRLMFPSSCRNCSMRS